MEEKFESSIVTNTKTPRLIIDSGWMSFVDLFINPAFFKRGIIIVSPTDSDEKLSEQDCFIINGREFVFSSSESACAPDARSVKNTTILLSALIHFSSTQESNVRGVGESPSLLFNKLRREEIFFPLLIDNEEESIGIYVYPWVSKPLKNYQFTGFSQFVTAGCMFGASMQGITQDGTNIDLINHRLQLKPGQIIHSINYDISMANPFELLLFSEFEKTCSLINAFSKPTQPNQLLYHLPSYDYILFGVKLFINKQMTFESLDSFVRAVYLKQAEYQKIIGDLCRRHHIEVQFLSPFDNLFDGVIQTHGADAILHQLEIDKHAIMTDMTTKFEDDIVKRCLYLLQTNTTNPLQYETWQDFILIDGAEYNDMESLFKTANAVIVAMASKHKHDYEICSLLPLSEKQIQIGYDNYRKKYNRRLPVPEKMYPEILNLTLFEPVVTYSPTTNGLLFYFSCCLNTLSTLIVEKKISRYAAINVSLFANSAKGIAADESASITHQNPIDLEAVLVKAKNPFEY